MPGLWSQRRVTEAIPNPLTHLKCLECGTLNSRPFMDGDYVFKEVEEKCPKCGASRMKIVGIYVEEEAGKKGL